MPMEPIYEPNPKHKEPCHHGKSGTLCPRWSWDIAQAILEESDLIGQSRFAVRDGMAFKGHEHAPGKWHGHPVAWNEVPTRLLNKWIRAKRITRRDVRKLRTVEDIDERLRGDSR